MIIKMDVDLKLSNATSGRWCLCEYYDSTDSYDGCDLEMSDNGDIYPKDIGK